MLNLIEQEASDLQTNEIILDEIYKLEKFDVISDSEVDEIKDKFKKKNALFREVLNKKQSMFTELMQSTEQLIALNNQQIKNESEKLQIQA